MAQFLLVSVTKKGTKSEILFDTKNPIALEKLHEGVADHGQTFELINRGYTPDVFKAGQWFEIEEAEYWYFLEVLPPMDFRPNAFSMCEFSTGNLTNAFLKLGNRYFCLTIERKNSVDFETQIGALAAHIL